MRGLRFLRHTESIGPMWPMNPRAGAASRWSAPSPGKGATGGYYAPGSSSAMSSGRLFLDRVARQQSPSLLHRHSQTKHWTDSTEGNIIERYCVFSSVSHPRGAPHSSAFIGGQ